MIKARGTNELGETFYVFGLSYANLERLKAGKPMQIDLAEIGLQGTLYVVAGETEQAIIKELAPMLDPAMEIREHHDDDRQRGGNA